MFQENSLTTPVLRYIVHLPLSVLNNFFSFIIENKNITYKYSGHSLCRVSVTFARVVTLERAACAQVTPCKHELCPIVLVTTR